MIGTSTLLPSSALAIVIRQSPFANASGSFTQIALNQLEFSSSSFGTREIDPSGPVSTTLNLLASATGKAPLSTIESPGLA